MENLERFLKSFDKLSRLEITWQAKDEVFASFSLLNGDMGTAVSDTLVNLFEEIVISIEETISAREAQQKTFQTLTKYMEDSPLITSVN